MQEVLVFVRRFFPSVLSLSVVAACGPAPQPVEDVVISPTLPTQVSGWTVAGERETYDTESIYAYIDGHAEVYLAYGMKRCVSQRYASEAGDDEIVVDLFEMASPQDAFGVFSHDRAGEVVEVGQGGVFRLGWLSFWKGSWYGSVYTSGDGAGTHAAVLDVGRSVAEAIQGGGEVPELVARMPAEGLDPTSVCFFRSPQILNAHVNVGAGNLFSLEPDVEGVVGKVDLGGTNVHLVLIRYPNESEAEAAEIGARDEKRANGTRPEILVGRQGTTLGAVIGADDGGGQAESLLADALGGQ